MSTLAFEEINPSSDSVIESLGITDARKEELCDMLEKTATANQEQGGTITSVMAEFSKLVATPQELSFINFAFGHAIGSSEGFSGVLRRLAEQN